MIAVIASVTKYWYGVPAAHGVTVTLAVADFEVSATLVACTVTVWLDVTTFGDV